MRGSSSQRSSQDICSRGAMRSAMRSAMRADLSTSKITY